MNGDVMRRVKSIYEGSDGDATKALYADLGERGPVGHIALNLLRAQKASARAKVYRGGVPGKGSYRSMAYDRKQWAMGNLCTALVMHADALGICWGWKRDLDQPVHDWVLYVDLPTGQVSFHTDHRGAGPDYPADFDGRHESEPRILSFAITVLSEVRHGA